MYEFSDDVIWQANWEFVALAVLVLSLFPLPTTIRMNAPAVLLVPPTPVNFEHQTPSPSSTATTSSSDSRTTSSRPETMFTTVDQERTSSETTIFSIYSMYGEEQAHRASWAAQGSMVNGDCRPKDSSTISSVNHNLPTHRRSSFLSSNGDESSSDMGLAYNDPLPSKSLPVIDLTEGVPDFQSGASSSAVRSSLRVSRTGFRPASTYTPPPALEPAPSELLEGSRPPVPVPQPAPPGIIRPSEFRTLSPGPSRSSGHSVRTRSVSPQSARSSQTTPPSGHKRQSTASTRELPPLPPSANPTPPSTPPPNLLRQASSPFLLSPKTSSKSPGHLRPNGSSPSSKISLVPSEGEDMDSFHVRNTYAILEVSGVKGDGYEEGVERTRARVGNTRQSQLNADAAIGDGSEKSKDLDPNEIELLGSVDR